MILDEVEGRWPNIVGAGTRWEINSNGWDDIIIELFDKLSKNPNLKLEQVKEKFGLLTIYMKEGSCSDYDLALVIDAMGESGKVCEYCGNDGKRTSIGNWIKVLCGDCAYGVEFLGHREFLKEKSFGGG
jgi:hypothetical protein